jgi:hypothetical protein
VPVGRRPLIPLPADKAMKSWLRCSINMCGYGPLDAAMVRRAMFEGRQELFPVGHAKFYRVSRNGL